MTRVWIETLRLDWMELLIIFSSHEIHHFKYLKDTVNATMAFSTYIVVHDLLSNHLKIF